MCGNMIPVSQLEAHVNYCLDHQGQPCICGLCSKPIPPDQTFFLQCQHPYCSSCLKTFIMDQIRSNKTSTIRCHACQTMISHHNLRDLLNAEELEQYERASVVEASGGSLVSCPNPKCTTMMELVIAEPTRGDIAQAKREMEGDRKITDEAARHRCQYRLRCRDCNTEFCAQCSAVPYHSGFLCDEWKAYGQSKHCRFCGEVVHGAASVCGSDECREKEKKACTAILRCGHHCCGIKGERTHLPCLAEDCPDADKAASLPGGQAGDEFCAICYVEDIRSAPCIRLDCGHIMHYDCVVQKIRARWPASRITFGFLECPLCKQLMHHKSIEAELAPCLAIKKDVEEKALRRLRELGLMNSDDIVKPGGPYYQKPLEYAMHRFSYFMCYKCKKPYYGGERVCEGDQVREYDPKELLCAGCCEFSAQTSCPIHGNDYIEWKCRFCCNVAVYFCWGTTHFCEMCHRKPSEMVHTPRDKLPKCTCKIKHPPNGEEFLLGCALCRLQQSCYK